MKSIFDIAYGSHPAQRLDVHLPDCASFPVFLYFHGGGLEAGSKADQKSVFEFLTAHGIAAVSADYRMYPDAAYPDFVDDAAAAAAWCHANMPAYGGTEIFIGGSSAGGFLSMMLCFDRRRLAAHNLSPMDFAGFVHDAGQPTCHFNVLRERGIDSRRVIIDDSAPLYHICDDPYPPMLFIVADHDMENRYEQTMLTLSTLKHFGHSPSLKIMQATHCSYVDEHLGGIVEEFLRRGDAQGRRP